MKLFFLKKKGTISFMLVFSVLNSRPEKVGSLTNVEEWRISYKVCIIKIRNSLVWQPQACDREKPEICQMSLWRFYLRKLQIVHEFNSKISLGEKFKNIYA